MIEVKIIEDSVHLGRRLTTMQLLYPWFIHPQVLTHRIMVRNSRSSRAVPVMRMLEDVIKNPAKPNYWGRNKKGMAASREIDNVQAAEENFNSGLLAAVHNVERYLELGVHKQTANRYLMPYLHVHTVLTGSDLYDVPNGDDVVSVPVWDHFFNLRCADDAQPEIQELACKMRDAYQSATPNKRTLHRPYVTMDERHRYPPDETARISSMRCARASYHAPDAVEPDAKRDLERVQHLIDAGHHSPLEHVASGAHPNKMYGCYKGWRPYRLDKQAA